MDRDRSCLSSLALQGLFSNASLEHLVASGVLSDESDARDLSRVAEGQFTQVFPQSAFDLHTRYRGVAIGIGELDGVLQGGIPSGFVVEVAGPSGCGKSRVAALIAAHHAVRTVLPALEDEMHGDDRQASDEATCVLYMQVDCHLRHCVSRIREAVEYHSTIQWEQAAYTGATDPSNRGYDADLIAEKAFGRISLVDIGAYLDDDAGLLAPFQAVLQLLEVQLAEWGCEGGGLEGPSRIVIIDSVAALVRRCFSGSHRETSVRHDAIAAFLQGLKDAAALFNVVIFIINHVVSDRLGDVSRMEDAPDERRTSAGSSSLPLEAAVRGAFGTTFYHAVNIRLVLVPAIPMSSPCLGADRVFLHIAKSPICPPHTFLIEGLCEELECYERVLGGAHRLRPSVRIGNVQ